MAEPGHHERPEPAPPAESEKSAERKVGVRDLFADLLTQSNLMLFGVAALLGLIGLVGGWDRVKATDTKLTRVEAKQTFAAEPFKLAFQEAFWYQNVPGLPVTGPDQRGVMVTVDITNTSPRPVSVVDMREVFRTDLPGQARMGRRADLRLLRSNDLLDLRTLQPGLLTRVVLVWLQPVSRPVPRKLNVTTYRQTYRKSSLDGTMRYFDEKAAAVISLPVQDLDLP